MALLSQLPNAKVAEHLVQNLQECSDVQEFSATLSNAGSEMPEAKIRELEIEFERLTSKIDHLKSQNDLLGLTLEESKAHSDHLSVLMGKYESNNTALQMAIAYSDQSLEAFDVLVALLESEQGVLLANCRAAGVGNISECHNYLNFEFLQCSRSNVTYPLLPVTLDLLRFTP